MEDSNVHGAPKAIDREKSRYERELEHSLCGDVFWKSEISAIAKELDDGYLGRW